MKILGVGVVALLCISQVAAQENCGPKFANTICGELGPCCSEYAFCGSTPAQCGGGCVEGFSTSGACYSSRPNGRQCISGHYRMGSNTTWLVPTDAYNGNPQTADFTIDRAGITPTNFRQVAGRAHITLTAPPSGLITEQGQGVRFSSTAYISPGSVVTIRVRPSGSGGVVTAFITMSDDLDEIDWEWTGLPANLGVGQANVFAKGVVDYTHATVHAPGRVRSPNLRNEFHNWTIDWSTTSLRWLVDGVVVRTETPTTLVGTYPVSPARVQVAIWDGGYASAGTRQWAGGYVNFSAPADARTAIIESITIQCAGDPVPIGPPARPPGWYPPNIRTEPLAQVVPGMPNFDPDHIGVGKISIANLETEQLLNPGSVPTITTRRGGSTLIPTGVNGGNSSFGEDPEGLPITVGPDGVPSAASTGLSKTCSFAVAMFFVLIYKLIA